MKLFFSTDWTTNDSLLTEVDNVITLHPQEVKLSAFNANVCLIAENEFGEIIATSGCGEEEPLITERFIRFWAESGFPAEMDIEISELYLEDNQLPEIPSEIQTFTDMYGNVYDSLEACEEGEKQITFQSMTKAEKEIENDMYLSNLEKEARKSMKKHKLVKRKDLPKRVDFSLLPNAASVIWSAVLLFGQEVIDVNSDIYQNAVKTANNLDLFMQCMKNPKFATLSSIEIEKLLR